MLGIIFRSMLITSIKDKITLFYAILFPILLLIGLGLYFDTPAYHETLLLGTLALSTLFWGVSGIAFQVHQQRNRGVYKLLRLAPFPTLSFILTMTLARTVLGIGINGIVYIAGVLFLKQQISILGTVSIFVLLTIGTLCFSCIGFFVANIAKNEGQINMISNLLFIPMLFGSEVFYSLDRAPEWVKVIGQCFPMDYLISGLQSALGNELNGHASGIVLLFTCAWAFLAVLTFRWDEHSTLLTSSPLKQDLRS